MDDKATLAPDRGNLIPAVPDITVRELIARLSHCNPDVPVFILDKWGRRCRPTFRVASLHSGELVVQPEYIDINEFPDPAMARARRGGWLRRLLTSCLHVRDNGFHRGLECIGIGGVR